MNEENQEAEKNKTEKIIFSEDIYEMIWDLDVNDYNYFRDLVGWGALPTEEAQAGIDHSFYKLTCKLKGETVGIARILWDHGYIAYLSDVIIHPDYQGLGIGKAMVQILVDKLRTNLKPGWKTKVTLMSAKGKEVFYEKLGFYQRPNDFGGAGMELWLKME